MEKLSLISSIAIIIAADTNAQGIGVGITTLKAAFNVAENRTVLFVNDTSSAGGKLM